MLSPSGLTFACPGEELTFFCSTGGSFMDWNVTILQLGRKISRSRFFATNSENIAPLMVGTKSFTIMANFTDVLTSTLRIDNTTIDLNGTKVRCTDFGDSINETSTSVATVHIIKVTGM